MGDAAVPGAPRAYGCNSLEFIPRLVFQKRGWGPLLETCWYWVGLLHSGAVAGEAGAGL